MKYSNNAVLKKLLIMLSFLAFNCLLIYKKQIPVN